MKIGILTYHRPSNFGANLQAFASYRYLAALGHQVKVIDYVRQKDIAYKKDVDRSQYEAHKCFVESRLPLTRQVTTEHELCKVVMEEELDTIVIGADAVWRKPEDGGIYFAKWLFDNEVLSQKVSVVSLSAAHMGMGFATMSAELREKIKSCLKQFKYISVRDSWTRDVINRDLFQGQEYVTHINPDPVIQLYRHVDSSLWEDKGLRDKGYVLMTLPAHWGESSKLSRIRRNWFCTFKKMVNQSNLRLVELPIPEGKSGMPFDYTIDYPIDPIQWFLTIGHARAFCGLRFHAIMSCIAQGTPFYSMDSYGANSRLTLLEDMLGLHALARKNDKMSKIRNLLLNTSFEQYRTGAYIEFESPKHILQKLLAVQQSDIIALRDSLENTFATNISAMLHSLEK